MNRHTLMCRTNLHHVWRTNSTEDGSRYLRCARCGKDRPDSETAFGDVRGQRRIE
jgi:hypothetical protein